MLETDKTFQDLNLNPKFPLDNALAKIAKDIGNRSVIGTVFNSLDSTDKVGLADTWRYIAMNAFQMAEQREAVAPQSAALSSTVDGIICSLIAHPTMRDAFIMNAETQNILRQEWIKILSEHVSSSNDTIR